MPLHVRPLRPTTLPCVRFSLAAAPLAEKDVEESFLSLNSSTAAFEDQPYKLHPKGFGERTQAPALMETGQGSGEAFALGPMMSCPFAFYRFRAASKLTRGVQLLCAQFKSPKNVEEN